MLDGGLLTLGSQSTDTITMAVRETRARETRVIDMMLSMHSRLRDRYIRRALVLDLLILSGSVVLCAAVLLDPQYSRVIRLTPDAVRVALACVSIAIFILSLVSLRADWKGIAGRHQQACVALFELKAKCRRLATDAVDVAATEDFQRMYDLVMSGLEPILFI